MHTSATNRKLRVLLTAVRDGSLVPNPAFQRRLVWSHRHKEAFLHTVLEGLPFPEIFLSAGSVDEDTGAGVELIVDGQQRITTLFQYFNGDRELKLTSSTPPYASLQSDEKIAFLEYEVVVRDLGPLSNDATRDLFQRINSTRYSLNAMEVNNSRYDGDLKQLADEIAADDFFVSHDVFTSLDGRRMNDTRFALTLVISVTSGYFNRDDDHDLQLAMFNDDYPYRHRVESELSDVFAFIQRCEFPRKCRIWQKADLLTALVEIHRALVREDRIADPSVVRERLTNFYDAVELVTKQEVSDPAVNEYYRRVRSGINDRTSRISRGEIIRDVLDGMVDPVVPGTLPLGL